MSEANQAPKAFTAREYARALRMTRQAVQGQIKSILPSGRALIRGNEAEVWTIAALPSQLRERLEEVRRQGGYRTAEDVLQTPPKALPIIKWDALSESIVQDAMRLRQALLPSLTDPSRETMRASEDEKLGIEDYKKAFGIRGGSGITDRYFRKLRLRTIERDGGLGQFERLELYLDERTFKGKRAASNTVTAGGVNLELLEDAVLSVRDPRVISEAKRIQIWARACETVQVAVENNTPEKKAKLAVLAYLNNHAPFMASSAESARKTFSNGYSKGIANGGNFVEAFTDRRRENSGNHREPFTDARQKEYCFKLLTWVSAKLNSGDILPAFEYLVTGRAWLNEKQIEHRWPENVCEYYKSYQNRVPALLAQLGVTAKECARYDRAPHAYEIDCPFNDRIHDHASMDWLQMDDLTAPVLYWEPDGNGWFNLFRGQLLPLIDCRSLKVLAFSLRSATGYNTLQIRTTITQACTEWKLPRKGFYFERGIWENSKLIGGKMKLPEDEVPWEETEIGLKALGLEIRHAIVHRAKVIEPSNGLFQNLMEGEPGYVGRDERHDLHEKVQRQVADVKYRRVHPAEHFYSKAEWMERLDGLFFNEHNNKRYHGKAILNNLTPNEAFEKFRNDEDPRIALDSSNLFFLSHNRMPVKVDEKLGVNFTIGKEIFRYRGHGTGCLEYKGRVALSWFNPECPDYLILSNRDMSNPVKIDRAHAISAMSATPDQLARENRLKHEHKQGIKEHYRVCKQMFGERERFRINVPDEATRRMNEVVTTSTAEVVAERRESGKKHRLQRELGIVADEQATSEDLEVARESLRKLARKTGKDIKI